jgi:hypothetical protein
MHCTMLVTAISLALCASGAAGFTEGLPATPTALQLSDTASDGYPPRGITTGRALLNTLVKRAPAGPEFRQAAFDYPVMRPDGCTTEEHVLIANASDPTMSSPCTVSKAQWPAVWDMQVLEDPAQVDVAHLVPLEEAWHSGAWAWTPEQRREFANDLTNSLTLTILSTGANKERGSSDPAHWWPPYFGVHCKYAQEWVWIKARWNLSVDPAEYDALMIQLDEAETNMCRNIPVGVPPLGLDPGVGPAAIIGAVVAGPPGIPFKGMAVQAYDADQSLVRKTQVRLEGDFELTGLPPGDYTVKFLGGTTGAADQWYSASGPGGPATVITLSAGGVASGIKAGMTAVVTP